MQVKVRVTAGARRESVEKENDTTFRIKVREPRERNLANSRIQELLAEAWRVEVKAIKLVRGHRSDAKTFSILLDKT